ncbi:cation transporting ATPase [Jimgerdemannia flammicorona]|uniref:Cation transporting ATPase n=1 Tax=Jimgerdemannia flammicorona TaxID=994334 RepID=A0A433A083_9FUNG|nr:cation transporting ATPase [Jimgerdemannia flammicorona]
MDTFAALALATDPPTPELLNRAPESRSAPLISFGMWKMIIGQAIFQLVITIVLLYSDILHLGTGTDGVGVMHTVVFNTFVFLQIFNEIKRRCPIANHNRCPSPASSCRVIDNKLNVFKGVLANKFFIFIFIVTVIIQVIITQFGGAAFQTVPLDATHWGICLGLGFVSLPIGVIIRLIPDEIFFFIFRNPETRALYLHQSQPSMPSVYVAGSERMAWNSAYSTVRKQLDVFKSLRGGRLRGSERRLSGTLAAAAMVPSLMATSVGTGWVPQEDGKVREGQVGETSQMDQPSREDTLSPEEDQDTWRKEYLKAQGGKKGKQDSASVKGAVERMKAEEESRPSFEMEERFRVVLK